MVALSEASRSIAGVLLVSIVAVELGGYFVLRVVRGGTPATDLQRVFFRAGHAHAGVLVTLALVSQLFVDAAELTGLTEAVVRQGVAFAAILIPAGYFLSVVGAGVTEPKRLIALVHLGAISLTAGVATLGVGLLVST